MGVERIALEHHGDPALGWRQSVDRPAANGDAPAIQLLKPGNRAQQGRFATPGRADDNAKFAICDVQANVAKHRCVAKRLVRPLYD